MRMRRMAVAALALGVAGGLGAGTAFGMNDGSPPTLSGGPIPGSSVLVCHAKNMGGSGVVVFHDNGKITGNGDGACLPE